MRCEDASTLLPEYSAGELERPGELEVHLASCADCSAELARYREMAYSLRAMALRVEEPSPALHTRLVATIPSHRVRDDVRRVARDYPQFVSVGTAALGATAIALLWWRANRRRTGVPAAVAAAVPVS